MPSNDHSSLSNIVFARLIAVWTQVSPIIIYGYNNIDLIIWEKEEAYSNLVSIFYLRSFHTEDGGQTYAPIINPLTSGRLQARPIPDDNDISSRI